VARRAVTCTAALRTRWSLAVGVSVRNLYTSPPAVRRPVVVVKGGDARAAARGSRRSARRLAPHRKVTTGATGGAGQIGRWDGTRTTARPCR